MVTCQSSELGWEVTVELPTDFLSLGRGSVMPTRWNSTYIMLESAIKFQKAFERMEEGDGY